MTLIIFLLILSILVLVHEFGHFYMAKRFGIRVEEFGLGIPPRIFSKKIGETLYSINLLPFGGFVKVTGEDLSDPASGGVAALSDPRSFASKSPGQRVAVLCAGVFMNMVLAVVIFYGVLAVSGYKTQYIPMIFEHDFKFGQSEVLGTVVTGILDGSSAQQNGLQIGEAVLEVDGLAVKNVTDLRNSLKGKLGQEVAVKLKDIRTEYDGATRVLNITPQSDEKGNVILGVYLTEAVSISYDRPVERLFSGFLHSYNVLDFSLDSFGQLISMSVKNKTIEPVSQSVAGPVGIYELINSLIKYGGNEVFIRLFEFVALMSISLAFINILPIPALDGGRVLFVIIEKIKGSPLSANFEAKMHKIGFLLLLGLLVLISIKDVLN